MSVSSSIGGIGQTAVGNTLGPEFAKLASALQDTTKGLQGWNSALSSGTSALKGFAEAGSASGLKPLNQSFELLASVVGVVVMPGIVLLGAAVASAAVVLMSDLEPALDSVAQWYANHIGDFEAFGKVIVDATRSVVDFVRWLNNSGPPRPDQDSNTRASDFTGPLGLGWQMAKLGVEADRAADLEKERLAGPHARNERGEGGPDPFPKVFPPEARRNGLGPDWNDPKNFVGPPAPPPPEPIGKQIQGLMPGMLRGMIAGMKQDQGAAPGFSGIADAWRKAQMSTFENPMQAMLRQNWEKTLTVLDKIAQRIEDQNKAPNAVQGGNGRAGK